MNHCVTLRRLFCGTRINGSASAHFKIENYKFTNLNNIDENNRVNNQTFKRSSKRNTQNKTFRSIWNNNKSEKIDVIRKYENESQQNIPNNNNNKIVINSNCNNFRFIKMADQESRMNIGIEENESISASQRRRQRKAEQAQQKKDEKQEREEEIDCRQYFQNRCTLIEEMKKNGQNPYPHKFQISLTLPQYIEEYKDIEDGTHLGNIHVQVAGRLMRVASSGLKLRFYDLHGEGRKIQIIANFSFFQDGDLDDFTEMHSILKRGDIVGVSGFPGKSKRGELSLFCDSIMLLSPCYHMLPEMNKLKDSETRYRQRYLDTMINKDNFEIFVVRSKIISFMRQYLEKRNFLEVETPMMTMIPGGAAAKPFKTHHNDLNEDLYMRIAPELYLKMLVIGGYERVFEIGKNFRNEGIDMTHNPEFTACEFYWAYADYEDLMNLTQDLLSSMVKSIHGSYIVEYHPDGPGTDQVVYLNFEPPFARISLVEEIEKKTDQKFSYPLDSDENVSLMIQLIKENNLEMPTPPTCAKLLDQLCGYFVERSITDKPTFIINHPQIMSPLAKWHRNDLNLTERFELFIYQKEICNAYTELNDPKKQRQCFAEQAKAKAAGDDEAPPIDEAFCTALEYGLPPTGGWGLGIDRLTMFLANRNTIKDVILFPAMRPQPNHPSCVDHDGK